MAAMYDQFGNYIGDDGVDVPTKTLEQTQATTPPAPDGVFTGQSVYTEDGGISNLRRNPETGELYDPGGAAGYAVAPSEAGVGQNDDSASAKYDWYDAGGAPAGDGLSAKTNPTLATSTATGTFNNNTRRLIIPQPNVLDRFSSYTYRASVYLMSSDQYRQLVLSRKKNINSYNLLFQSAGAPAASLGGLGGVTAPLQNTTPASSNPALPGSVQAAAGRNPAFDVDFYIDSITINNLIQGKSTGSAHGVSDMKFTVIEPYGITLIDRIYEAVQKFAPPNAAGKGINYANAHYLMVIRWYGYDSEGNIVTVGAADPKTGLTDPNAVVEKFIPFMINKIDWSVTTRATSYEFDCTATPQIVAAGTRRGQVPYDIQLTATTVRELLDGQTKYTSDRASMTDQNQSDAETRRLLGANAAAVAAAPAKANAADQAKKVVTSGLMAALTQYQKILTEGPRPIFDQYDEYYIEFTPRAKAIADARLIIPGSDQEAKTSGTKPPATQDSNSINPRTDSKNNNAKVRGIYAGQPIVQVIDQVIRNSTFITDQQLTQINSDNEEIPNPGARDKPVNWYSIRFRAEPKADYDFLRNDHAYKITYIIDIYPLDKYDSKYFPVGSFRGVHKSYPWWFTGQNTAVLEYSESLNTAFNTVVSGTTPENSAAENYRRKIAGSMRDLITYTYGPASGETRQGAESKAFEGSANLADSLYGGADLAETKLKIIGDPAWIQQGSLAGGITAEDLDNASFLSDGTINFDGEQILFEVQWNRPSDYDINTGLQNPNSGKSQLAVSRVYIAATVTSELRQGKFEQTIHGLLYQLPKPDGSNKAPTAPMPVPKNRDPVDVARNAPAGVTTEVNGHLMTNTRGPEGATQWYERGAIVYRKPPGTANPSLRSAPNSDNPPVTAPQENTTVQQTPNVQPQNPPQPPTSGTGENISFVDRALNFIAGKKINQTDLQPSTPQEQARDS